ncbi:hypothetical protein K501DRAFT_271465 [Backusella circina FSU 941]|nr:hypothetical protein K501DRAFT_271465 [Backusella circina FSU 941]
MSHQMLNDTIPDSIYTLINLKLFNFGHNALTGIVPNEISNLTKLESLNFNYNLLNGQFPSIDAPPALGYCVMTPNQFQSCPSKSILSDPKSLAFQCSIDCSGINSKKQSDAVMGSSCTVYSILLALIASYLIF